MISPITEYDSWCCILSNSIAVKGGYHLLLPDFQDLIFSIITDGILPEPISTNTNQFINELVPSTVHAILELIGPLGDELKADFEFLGVVLNLIIALFMSNQYQLDIVLYSILSKWKKIYTYDHTNGYDTLVSTFIGDGNISILLEMAQNTNNIDLFIIFIRTCCLIGRKNLRKYEIEDEIEPGKIIFENIIKDFTNDQNIIKTIDYTKFTRLIDDFLELYSFSSQDNSFDYIFDFLFSCLKTESFDKQRFAASIFKKILEKNKAMNYSTKWALNSNFIDYIIEKNLHTEVLNCMVEWIIHYFAKYPDESRFAKLWTHTINSHISDRTTYLFCISEILKFLPNNVIDSFLNTNVFTIPLTSDSKELLHFLMLQEYESYTHKVITFLYENAKSDETCKLIMKHAIESQIKNKISQEILDLCIDDLKKDNENKLAIVLLPWLISKYNQKDDHETFKKQLFDLLPINRRLVLKLLHIFYNKNSIILELNEIEQLAQTIDDDFWIFLYNLFVKNGKSSATLEVFKYLSNLYNAQDYETESIYFGHSLYAFIIVFNYSLNVLVPTNKKQIDPIPTQYYFKQRPICLSLLFRLLEETTNEKIAKEVMEFLCQLILYIKNCNFKFINIEINDSILPKIQEQSECTTIYRFLNLLYLILTKSEIEYSLNNYGLIQHQTLDDSSMIRLYSVTNNDIHSFFMPLSATVAEMKEILNQFYDEEVLSLTINDDYVGDYNTLSENGVRNFSKVKPCPYTRKKIQLLAYPDLPSYLLFKKKFVQFLLSSGFLGNDQLRNITWKLLKYLPDPLEVTNEIFNYLDVCELKYNLQTILLKIFWENYVDCSFNEKLIQLLLSDDEEIPYVYYEIIRILLHTYDEVCMQSDIELFQFLIFILDTEGYKDKLLTKTADLIYLIVAKSEHPQLLIGGCMPIIQGILENPNPVIWHKVCKIFQLIPDHSEIFELMLPMLDDIQNTSKYTVDLFATLLPTCSEKFDLSSIFKKCIRIVHDAPIETLGTICTIIRSIVASNNQIVTRDSNLIKLLLPRAFQVNNSSVQNIIFETCNDLKNFIDDGNKQIIAYLSEFFDVTIDRWSYHPSENKKKFAGLSNLGATCYMNSIFQQLYFNKNFRKRVFQHKFEKEDQLQFQKLFAKMLASDNSSISTRQFCDVWTGWGKQPISTKEQQDAVEFLNLFLDQLPPELTRQYKGKIVNHIVGINEEYNSDIEEEFYFISMEVEHYKDLNNSFQCFLQEEIFSGENQIYAESLNKKIDTKKYSRIKNAPQNLILHLKRFNYDYKKQTRTKLNSPFIFGQEINIKDIMDDKNNDMPYKLKGIVMHSGTATGGHYISVIRINKLWYKFNDSEVTKISFSEIEKEAFSLNQNNKPNAYLLFYQRSKNKHIKVGSPLRSPPSRRTARSVISDEKLISPDLYMEIKQENEQFCMMQSRFSEPTLFFTSNCEDYEVMTHYYFNIFVHSDHVDITHVITEKLKSEIKKKKAGEWFYQYLNANFELVLDIYKNCSKKEILGSLVDLISNTMTECSYDTCYSFIDQIVRAIPLIMPIWRQIPYIAIFPDLFIDKYWKKRHFTYNKVGGIDNLTAWVDIFHSELLNFYTVNNNFSVLQMVNFKHLFMFITRLIPDTFQSQLPNYSTKILNSPNHLDPYFEFSFRINKIDYAELSCIYATQTATEFNKESFTNFITKIICYSDFDVIGVIKCVKDQNFLIISNLLDHFSKEVDSGNILLKDKLIKNYPNLILLMLIDEHDYTRKPAEIFVYKLFPDIKHPNHNIDGTSLPQYNFIKPNPIDNNAFDPRMEQLLVGLCNTPIPDVVLTTHERTNDILVYYLRVLKWLMKRSKHYVFAPMFELFNKCELISNSDHNMNIYAFLYLFHIFPPDALEGHGLEIFQNALAHVKKCNMFRVILYSVPLLGDDLYLILTDEYIPYFNNFVFNMMKRSTEMNYYTKKLISQPLLVEKYIYPLLKDIVSIYPLHVEEIIYLLENLLYKLPHNLIIDVFNGIGKLISLKNGSSICQALGKVLKQPIDLSEVDPKYFPYFARLINFNNNTKISDFASFFIENCKPFQNYISEICLSNIDENSIHNYYIFVALVLKLEASDDEKNLLLTKLIDDALENSKKCYLFDLLDELLPYAMITNNIEWAKKIMNIIVGQTKLEDEFYKYFALQVLSRMTDQEILEEEFPFSYNAPQYRTNTYELIIGQRPELADQLKIKFRIP